MNNVTGEGVYFIRGEYIAFRDNAESKWRLSRIESNGTPQMTLTLIGTYEYIWEIMHEINK